MCWLFLPHNIEGQIKVTNFGAKYFYSIYFILVFCLWLFELESHVAQILFEPSVQLKA